MFKFLEVTKSQVKIFNNGLNFFHIHFKIEENFEIFLSLEIFENFFSDDLYKN